MVKLNLLPPEMRGDYSWVAYLCRFAAVVALAVFAAVYACGQDQIADLQAKVRQNEETYDLLRRSVSRKKEIERELRIVEEKNRILIGLTQKSHSWYSVLIHASDLTPQNVWLDAIRAGERSELVLRGKAMSYQDLAVFLDHFERDGLLEDAVLVNSSAANIPQIGRDIVEFEISAKFKEI